MATLVETWRVLHKPGILTTPVSVTSSVYGCELSCVTGCGTDLMASVSEAASSSSVTHSSVNIPAMLVFS